MERDGDIGKEGVDDKVNAGRSIVRGIDDGPNEVAAEEHWHTHDRKGKDIGVERDLLHDKKTIEYRETWY